MSPYILGLPAYAASQAVGLVVATMLMTWLAGAPALPRPRVVAAWGVLVAAAILGAVLTAPSLRPTAGLRYSGTGIAVLLALPVAWQMLARAGISLLAFADVLAAPLVFGLGIARVGCFLHGCCHGPVSRLPWAVAFPAHSLAWSQHVEAGLVDATAAWSLPVHPLPLYFASWCVGVAALVVLVRSRKPPDGVQSLLALSLYAAGGYVVETYKAPPDPAMRSALLVTAFVTAALLLARSAHGAWSARAARIP